MNASFALIALAVVCGIAGQLSLKAGMTQVGSIGVAAVAQPLQLVLRVLVTPLVLIGLALYVLGAVAWLGVLSRVPLSLAYPLLATSYAITPILAWLLFGETLTALRWAGIGTICAGVILVARS